MYFASPHFLYALGLLAIPIIIHLFSFYIPKTVLFTNVRLLKDIKEEQKRFSKIKSWILLLLRCMAYAAFILAFAEPTLPKGAKSDNNETLGIYLDNSFSMATGSVGNSNFYSAKAQAKKWVNQFPANKQFVYNTNLSEGQRILSKAEALEAINETSVSSLPGNWEAVRHIQLNHTAVNPIVVLSDFQTTNFSQNFPVADSNSLILTQLTGNTTSNISIDSITTDKPIIRIGETVAITVWITNFSDTEYEEYPVSIRLNGVEKAPVNVKLSPNTTTTATFAILMQKAGWMQGAVSINDNPITFDNQYRFAFEVTEKLAVLQIGNEPNPYLQRLFANDADFDFSYMPLAQFDLAALQNTERTVFLNHLPKVSSGLKDALINYTAQGGNLVIVLDSLSSKTDWNPVLVALGLGELTALNARSAEISSLSYQDPFYTPIFAQQPNDIKWPMAKSHWNVVGSIQTNALLSFSSGNSFLSKVNYQGGQAFLFTSGFMPEYGNFQQHGLFAPVLLRITEYAGTTQNLAYTLGSEKGVYIRANDRTNAADITLVKDQVTLLPTCQRKGNSLLCYLSNLPLEEGWYEIKNKNESLGFIAVNANREESEMAFLNQVELGTLLDENNLNYSFVNTDASNSSVANISDEAIWPYFIGLALLFLILEMIWLKWKVQTQSL